MICCGIERNDTIMITIEYTVESIKMVGVIFRESPFL